MARLRAVPTGSALAGKKPSAAGPEPARRACRRAGAVNGLWLAVQLALFPLVLLLAWQLVTEWGWIKRNVIPPPLEVLSIWYDLITGGTGQAGRYAGSWWDHAFSSTWRVFAGFAWGIALGVVLGLLIGLSRVVERMLDVTLQVLRTIPVTAWVPLSLVFFGIGNAPAVFLIGLGAFFPTVINTTLGVRQIDKTLVKAALMMGASRAELLSRVVLKGALPSIFAGIRLSMGIAWVLVVVAEMLAVRSGLGYLLNDAYQFYRNDVVIATMLSIGMLGYLSDRLVVLARDHFLQWNAGETYSG